jgi:hypothetical protein
VGRSSPPAGNGHLPASVGLSQFQFSQQDRAAWPQPGHCNPCGACAPEKPQLARIRRVTGCAASRADTQCSVLHILLPCRRAFRSLSAPIAMAYVGGAFDPKCRRYPYFTIFVVIWRIGLICIKSSPDFGCSNTFYTRSGIPVGVETRRLFSDARVDCREGARAGRGDPSTAQTCFFRGITPKLAGPAVSA